MIDGDLAIEVLAASEARLRATVDALVATLADLTIENFTLRKAFEHQYLERVYAQQRLDLYVRRHTTWRSRRRRLARSA